MEVQISKEMVTYLNAMQDGVTVADKVNLSLVLGLFSSKRVTLDKAAELAGKSVWDFVDLLSAYQIPWGEYTDEGRDMDRMALQKMATDA